MRLATLADTSAINAWVERDCGREVDFTDFLSNTMNACLIEGEGGAMFVWRAPGIFEVHVFFEPRSRAHRKDKRGERILGLSHRMLEFMRKEFGARWFWSPVPIESRHVIMFARLMGWKSQGMANFPHGWCEIFSTENV